MTTLEQIFKTQPYLAVRIMSEFDDNVIEEIKRSHKYDQLFTPTMQNELYRLKCEHQMSEELYEEVSKFHRENKISWTRIYFVYTNRSWDELFIDDDLDGFKLSVFLEKFIFGVDAFDYLRSGEFTEFNEDIEKYYIKFAKRIQMYILQNNFLRDQAAYDDYLADLGKYSDVNWIKTIRPIVKEILIEKGLGAHEADMTINSDLAIGAIDEVNVEILNYLMDLRFVFTEEDMILLAHAVKHYHPDRGYIIDSLVSRGAPPVDRDFYIFEFGEEY